MKTFKRGESIVVREGEEFELALDVQAASGYEWQVAEKAPGLTVLGSTFAEPAKDRIGGASQQRIRFRAEQPGTAGLHLVSKRAWEAAPSESLTVQVAVQGRK